ncbi:MAG: hypothetical protein Unbinned706contig1000_16 [Prokaryotic dsDNA virus sp.]|nr:MAG: hypothetical protein Unbinned706contig1000_16 [Prokaryotic dsDNA virus sp.]|tara:strand:+ start:16005 stop:16862 length:858 start_codon:yes stop_codon:yes gene_type:complete
MTDANETTEDVVLTPKINPKAESVDDHFAKQEDIQEAQAAPEVESITESSPVSEDNHEEKTNGVQKRINDITAQRYQEQRRADDLQAQLDALKGQQTQPVQQEKQESKLQAPSVPDDIYDEDAMRKYHADSQAYNAQVATQAAQTQFENQQKQGAEQAQQAKQKAVIEQYTTNALRDGVDLDKLRVAEQSLNQAGISPELGSFIMNDPNGAKIATYLADNPAEMYDILQKDSVSAGIQIANQIKPKVLSQTPKVSKAPDPIPEVSGGGFVEKDDFDKTYSGYEIL